MCVCTVDSSILHVHTINRTHTCVYLYTRSRVPGTVVCSLPTGTCRLQIYIHVHMYIHVCMQIQMWPHMLQLQVQHTLHTHDMYMYVVCIVLHIRVVPVPVPPVLYKIKQYYLFFKYIPKVQTYIHVSNIKYTGTTTTTCTHTIQSM